MQISEALCAILLSPLFVLQTFAALAFFYCYSGRLPSPAWVPLSSERPEHSLSDVFKGNHRAHFVFHSSGTSSPLPDAQCLENYSLIYFVCFFSCFKQEITVSYYYSILAGSCSDIGTLEELVKTLGSYSNIPWVILQPY